ncbi:MAG: fatty acid hydroxylase [Bacteroidetes bacterium]|nr:MAG: fatty acid hydroxylase [Bacteroidota bacterium]PTM12690.1 MAG: fatty acid hydroxylase [Bacteroidota bacterium]
MEVTTISKLIPVTALLVLGALEAIGGLYFEDKRTKNDFTIELLSLVTLPTLIQPGIFILVLGVLGATLPGLEDSLVGISWGWQLLAFLVLDDMTQYWWHRLSHVNRKMWKLHRPHHVVEEMGVLVTYRNATLYYALMPGIWFSALLVYLGMGYVYLFYLPVKLVVILLAHSETKWDRFLYRYKILSPLAWIVERTISTPSTHFAHHGLTAEDGISHPNGNYGNLLFIWDMIFGTAKITRKYPSRFGAWNQIKEPWYVQLFFPLVRSKDPNSELHSIKTKNDYDPSVDFKEFSN